MVMCYGKVLIQETQVTMVLVSDVVEEAKELRCWNAQALDSESRQLRQAVAKPSPAHRPLGEAQALSLIHPSKTTLLADKLVIHQTPNSL